MVQGAAANLSGNSADVTATLTATMATGRADLPDQRTAQASRSAASKVTSGMMSGDSARISVTGTAVTGRVLSFDMTAIQPRDFPELVDYNGLGVDICP